MDDSYQSSVTPPAVTLSPFGARGVSTEVFLMAETPLGLAGECLRRGELTEALLHADRELRRIGGDLRGAHLARAGAFIALGRLTEGAEELHEVLRIDPENPSALVWLGDIHFVRGAEEAAFSYYEKTLEVAPNGAFVGWALVSSVTNSLRRIRAKTQNAQSASTLSQPISESKASSLNIAEIAIESGAPLADARAMDDTMTLNSVANHRENSAVRLTIRRPEEKSTAPVHPATAFAVGERFQTETMADIYLRQGHAALAAQILRKLVARDPLPRLVDKLKKAEESLARRVR